MKTPFALLAFAATATSIHAAVLVDWNLNTVTGPTTNNTQFTGVSASTATVAQNLDVSTLGTNGSWTNTFDSERGLVWSSGNAGAGKLNLQRWDYVGSNTNSTTSSGDGTPNNWLQFTLTADPGYSVALTTIDLSAWRNGVGAPANWAFGYSTDNGVSWTQFGDTHTESNSGDTTFRDVTFTGSVTSGHLLIRFTAVGTPGGTGNLHINKMVLEGTVIPEPSTVLLGGIGLLALFRRRR